jgi:predicted Ser/Thr protein kinase
MIDSVGKYRILELIGQGGAGVVYKALDPLLKRVVAIKVIADTAVTDELRARFFREARAAANLSHRNIVTVYDLGEDHEQLFLVMEYLEGEELRRGIATGRELSVEVKVALMMQVCDALAYAHAKGVVHRDIKPANIFVLHDQTVKILDFGVARIATADDGLTQTGHIMGTLRYMSPEQARGRADPRSDMFSAGAVFYELLTSRSPLLGRDPLSILEELSSTESPSVFRPNPTIPEDLAAVIERMLRKDPSARYADMAEVRNALDGVRARLGTEVRDLRRRLESLAARLRELEAALAEMGFDPASPTPPLSREGTPVAVLEKLLREYEERVARLRLLRDRASAVRPEYEQAMKWLDAGEWAAAMAGFERLVEEIPEHVLAQEGLTRARAEGIRANELAAQREREAAESARHMMEDARSRPEAPDNAGNAAWSEAQTMRAAALAAFADQRYTAARSQFDAAAAQYRAAAAGVRQREQSGWDGEGPAWEPPGSASAETTIAETPAQAHPSAATNSGPAIGVVAPDLTARESGTAAAPGTSPRIRPTRLRFRTLALGSLALTMALAVAWLASSITTSRRLQAEVMEARQRADASRAEALNVEAPLLARALFDEGATKDREGQQLAGARRFGPAVAPLREAAARYADAARAARTAREARDRADHARAEMLAARKNAAPETTEFREAVARQQEADDRYRQLAFADAAGGFEAAALLFAKALPPPVAPAAPAPTAGEDAKEEIRGVLRLYARAFERKDLALLQQVRPALRADELSRYRATFDQVRSYRLTLKVDTVTVRGEEAEAKGRREDVVVTGNGDTIMNPGEFRFRLRRVSNHWTIDAVK